MLFYQAFTKLFVINTNQISIAQDRTLHSIWGVAASNQRILYETTQSTISVQNSAFYRCQALTAMCSSTDSDGYVCSGTESPDYRGGAIHCWSYHKTAADLKQCSICRCVFSECAAYDGGAVLIFNIQEEGCANNTCFYNCKASYRGAAFRFGENNNANFSVYDTAAYSCRITGVSSMWQYAPGRNLYVVAKYAFLENINATECHTPQDSAAACVIPITNSFQKFCNYVRSKSTGTLSLQNTIELSMSETGSSANQISYFNFINNEQEYAIFANAKFALNSCVFIDNPKVYVDYNGVISGVNDCSSSTNKITFSYYYSYNSYTESVSEYSGTNTYNNNLPIECVDLQTQGLPLVMHSPNTKRVFALLSIKMLICQI